MEEDVRRDFEKLSERMKKAAAQEDPCSVELVEAWAGQVALLESELEKLTVRAESAEGLIDEVEFALGEPLEAHKQ